MELLKNCEGKILMLAQPCGIGFCDPDPGTWLAKLSQQLVQNDKWEISGQVWGMVKNARIAMSRNLLVKIALENNADYLLMVDPDMRPDMYSGWNDDKAVPWQGPFFHDAMDFLKINPCCVCAAPACGGRPNRDINVWRFGGTDEKGNRLPPFRVSHQQGFEAWKAGQIELVDAIGTGLMLIDMGVFRYLKTPYFDDVYTDKAKTELHLSQDVYFTRKCNEAGIPVACFWGSFAGHWKSECVGIPGAEDFIQEYRESLKKPPLHTDTNTLPSLNLNSPCPTPHSDAPATITGSTESTPTPATQSQDSQAKQGYTSPSLASPKQWCGESPGAAKSKPVTSTDTPASQTSPTSDTLPSPTPAPAASLATVPDGSSYPLAPWLPLAQFD